MPPLRLAGIAREPTVQPVVKDATSAQPTPSLLYSFGGFPSSTGVPVTPLTALQAAAVYGCVKARSEDLGKVPLMLRRRARQGGWLPDRTHPISRLLARPNRWMTWIDFVSYWETSMCLRGNAYVVILRGHAGEPVELVPVSPDTTSVSVSAEGYLYYTVSHKLIGQNVKLHQDNVLHSRGMIVDGGYIGASPIACAQEAIGLALATQQHGAILFRQGAQLSGVITHPGDLSAEAKNYLSDAFSSRFAGVQNAHKVPVLDEGMKFEKLAMTNQDSQFLETRAMQRIEICAIFRVPPHKVMDLSRATFSNIENQEQSYINDALMPDAERLAQEMTEKLLFDDERSDWQFWHDWDSLLRADRKTRYEGHAIGLNNGFLNVNSVHDVEGMPHIPGGETYRTPLNLGATNEPKPAPSGVPGDMPPDSTEQQDA